MHSLTHSYSTCLLLKDRSTCTGYTHWTMIHLLPFCNIDDKCKVLCVTDTCFDEQKKKIELVGDTAAKYRVYKYWCWFVLHVPTQGCSSCTHTATRLPKTTNALPVYHNNMLRSRETRTPILVQLLQTCMHNAQITLFPGYFPSNSQAMLSILMLSQLAMLYSC